MDRSKQLYFEFLCRILMKKPWQCAYNRLLRFLYDTEYEWDHSIYSDSSRASDGLNLRHLYFDGREEFDDECSVLEMMAGLSIRIDRDITGEPGDDHPEKWFWEMIDNLDLLEDDDKHFSEEHVTDVLQRFTDRDYSFDGRGGLFPLREPSEDQRKVPIWNQMASYLNERSDEYL